MRIVPIITAVLVSVALYLLIFERDAVLDFARDTPIADEGVETEVTPTEVADAVVPETDETTAMPMRVVVLSSEAQTVEGAVILRGRTEAARQVTVAAETSGAVVSEPLRAGAFVEQGDLLCELDPGTRASTLAETRARLSEAEGRVPEAEAAVAEAQARIREAEVNLNAAQRLSEDGFASETRLIGAEASLEAALAGLERARGGVSSARAGIESAEAAVAVAEREMTRLQITAPFEGLLETDTAELGSLMQPGTPCATIIQLDPIKMVGFVPEADVSKIETGSLAGARLIEGEDVTGTVSFVSRSADEVTRTFRVEVTVPNADLRIGDGQTAEILISADGRQAHLIPQSALTLNDDGLLGVRTLAEGDVAMFMPVTILRDTTEGVWVTDLPEQIDIITVGQEFVTDGVKVQPTYAEAAL